MKERQRRGMLNCIINERTREIRWRISSAFSNARVHSLSVVKRWFRALRIAAEESIQDAKRTRWRDREWLNVSGIWNPSNARSQLLRTIYQWKAKKKKKPWKENRVNRNRTVTNAKRVAVRGCCCCRESNRRGDPSELDFCHLKIRGAFRNRWPFNFNDKFARNKCFLDRNV